jgi:tetratricopeptide (TPR) repeat protein
MEKDLGAEIYRYREMLAREPNSYCFAPLADLYRKTGLLDDAIAVARRGCELHPDYVGGYLALGRACREKGLNDESVAALEKVAVITPDNLLAQKLLSRIYLEQGDVKGAEKSLKMVLAQSPDDFETRALLDSLVKESADESASGLSPIEEMADIRPSANEDFEIAEDDEGILEDLEIIEELSDEDLLEFDEDVPSQDAGDSPAGFTSPVVTVTMAELYQSQGFAPRALAIYRELLATDPYNADLQKRIRDVTALIEKDAVGDRGSPAARAEDVSNAISPEQIPIEEGSTASVVVGNNVVETLEKWLEAIKRRR